MGQQSLLGNRLSCSSTVRRTERCLPLQLLLLTLEGDLQVTILELIALQDLSQASRPCGRLQPLARSTEGEGIERVGLLGVVEGANLAPPQSHWLILDVLQKKREVKRGEGGRQQ